MKFGTLFGSKNVIDKVISEKYDIGKKLGTGNFAVVYQVTNKTTNKDYALKVIAKKKIKGKEHVVDGELELLRKIQHPHIIALIEVIDGKKNLYIVTEIATGGDLFESINAKGKIEENESRRICREVLLCLQYLHKLNIVHRDLKPENILLSSPTERRVLVSDFGLATTMRDGKLLREACGSPEYVAPEVLRPQHHGYGTKADLWSVGVVAYIMLCGEFLYFFISFIFYFFYFFLYFVIFSFLSFFIFIKIKIKIKINLFKIGYHPFAAADLESRNQLIRNAKFEFHNEQWGQISLDAKDFIKKLIEIDTNERLDATDALAHPWLSSLQSTPSELNSDAKREQEIKEERENLKETMKEIEKEKAQRLSMQVPKNHVSNSTETTTTTTEEPKKEEEKEEEGEEEEFDWDELEEIERREKELREREKIEEVIVQEEKPKVLTLEEKKIQEEEFLKKFNEEEQLKVKQQELELEEELKKQQQQQEEEEKEKEKVKELDESQINDAFEDLESTLKDL